MRFLKIVALFSVLFVSPFFAFAQTATTTEQPASVPAVDYQKMIDQLINAGKQNLPSNDEIVNKTINDNLEIKTTPHNPGPNETVHITIESYITDLNKATISWIMNGKIVEKGIGKTEFSFKNGASGVTTRLTVSIITNTGEKVVRDLAWNPVGVTIMWEADTYTPPFYKGKALMSPQARIKAIAIPDNVNTRNALGAGNLVYVWKKDGGAISDASGYGKNVFSFLGPIPGRNASVSVQVSSVNDSISSEMQLNEIPLVNPFILFYENHPLLGSWYNRSLNGDLSLTKKEFSVNAEPYFFSNEISEAPTLLYSWSLNNKKVNNPGRSITLRNEVGETGDSQLTLAMHGTKQTFQAASRDLTIHFTAAASARPTF